MTDPTVNPTRPPTPAWVKALGLALLVIVLVVIVAMLVLGGGEHGPGRHTGWLDAQP